MFPRIISILFRFLFSLPLHIYVFLFLFFFLCLVFLWQNSIGFYCFHGIFFSASYFLFSSCNTLLVAFIFLAFLQALFFIFLSFIKYLPFLFIQGAANTSSLSLSLFTLS